MLKTILVDLFFRLLIKGRNSVAKYVLSSSFTSFKNVITLSVLWINSVWILRRLIHYVMGARYFKAVYFFYFPNKFAVAHYFLFGLATVILLDWLNFVLVAWLILLFYDWSYIDVTCMTDQSTTNSLLIVQILCLIVSLLFGCCMHYSTFVPCGDALWTDCSFEYVWETGVILIIRFYRPDLTAEFWILMLLIFFSLLQDQQGVIAR